MITEIKPGTWILALACALSAAPIAADQPQWGERFTRNMVSGEKGLPDDFDPETGRNVKWSVPLGTQTHSTPIAAGGKVFVGTNNDRPRNPRRKGDLGVLLCLDGNGGKLLWQLVAPKIGGDPYLDWPHTGMVSSPTVEGDRIYMVTNRGEVVCLDMNGQSNGNDGPYRDEGRHMAPEGGESLEVELEDADILWLFDIRRSAGIHPHDGAHSSILLHGDFLYINTSNGVDNTHRVIRSPDAPSLIVLEKSTGRLVARDEERMGPRTIHCTWSSPSLGDAGGRTLIFFGGGDGLVYAFEALKSVPAEGKVEKLNAVWRFDCDPGAPKENVHRWQDNRNESPSTISGMPVFDGGRVYVTAGGDFWHGKLKAWLKCIDASGSGDITKRGEVWSYPLERHCMSTPAIRDGLVFIADCGGKVHCLDAGTGRPFWIHETKGEIWASTLVADGKVYAGTQRGDFWILAAGKEKKVLGSIELDGGMSGTPTAADGILYVATMSRLYAFEKTPSAGAR